MEEKKEKRNIFEWLEMLLNGFLMFFFIFYIGKFSITNLILIDDNPWKLIFNIGVWYVLVMYCADKFFDNLKWKNKKKVLQKKI